MKNYIFLFVVFFSINASIFAQIKFEVNEYNLMCMGRPALKKDIKPVSLDTSAELFKKIKNSPIQFNYLQGNCHNRAHIISLMLNANGIETFKIWAFAPGKYSLIDTTLFKIKDKNGLASNNQIEWGYHVATGFFVNGNSEKDMFVIDPAVFPDKPVPYSEWLKFLNQEKLMFTVIDSEWYLFNTLEGRKVFNNPSNDPTNCTGDKSLQIPDWFPGIMTGDFFKYENQSKSNNWLEKGLAIDSTAYNFYINEIKPIENDTDKAELLKDYKLLAGNINNFESYFRDNKTNLEITPQFIEKHKTIIEKYRKVYEIQVKNWTDFVSSINNKKEKSDQKLNQ